MQQMVQFECPKVRNPLMSLTFGVNCMRTFRFYLLRSFTRARARRSAPLAQPRAGLFMQLILQDRFEGSSASAAFVFTTFMCHVSTVDEKCNWEDFKANSSNKSSKSEP